VISKNQIVRLQWQFDHRCIAKYDSYVTGRCMFASAQEFSTQEKFIMCRYKSEHWKFWWRPCSCLPNKFNIWYQTTKCRNVCLSMQLL